MSATRRKTITTTTTKQGERESSKQTNQHPRAQTETQMQNPFASHRPHSNGEVRARAYIRVGSEFDCVFIIFTHIVNFQVQDKLVIQNIDDELEPPNVQRLFDQQLHTHTHTHTHTHIDNHRISDTTIKWVRKRGRAREGEREKELTHEQTNERMHG
jgi:hypothetical protein